MAFGPFGREDSAAGGNNINAKIKVDLPGVDAAAAQIAGLAASLKDLKKSLGELAGAGTFASNINTLIKGIGATAATTAGQIGQLTSAVGSVSSSGSSSAPAAPSGSSGSGSWTTGATASAGSAIAAAGGGTTASAAQVPGGIDITGAIGSIANSDFTKSMAMFPLRFMRDTIATNRQTALTASAAMSMNSFASGANAPGQAHGSLGSMTGITTGQIMSSMAHFPGSIYGTPSDQMGLFANSPSMGAFYNFADPNTSGKRTSGYFAGIREAQLMNPGAPVSEIAGAIGGFSSNTRAQQTAQMVTGGAFGMIKPGGGGQKSLSEWAESILRWLEGLRPGSARATPFNYGELMAQYFPGSNIDAWFDANGVPQNMREYWWTYALAKAKTTGGTGKDNVFDAVKNPGGFKVTGQEDSVAFQRLKATTSLTQTQFSLAGTMSGQYANKEQANRWMADLMGAFQEKIVPKATTSGPMSFIQNMPDTMEQLLMTLLERSGKLGTALGAYAGYGGFSYGGSAAPAPAYIPGTGLPNPAADIDPSKTRTGDIGDQYTTTGGTGTAGLHPDMARKVKAMQRANPAISVTSGLRDHAMQQRLKKRGFAKVSGKPSAHTRGMAADLGPASQYGWISQNAGKFGLSSGVSQGEPWHVGIGDFDDEGLSALGGVISGFMSMVGTGGGTDSIGGMSTMASSFLGLLAGLIGGNNETNFDKLKFNPDLYNLLYAKSAGTTVGGITAAAPGTISTGGGGGGGGSWLVNPGAATPGGMTQTMQGYSGGRTALYGGSVMPASEAGSFTSANEMTRGAAVAKAMWTAGFRGQDLKNFTSIAYRESRWHPEVWVTDSDDVGGGLVGLNQLPWLKKGMTPPYSKEDLQDPYGSAAIAYAMFNGNVPGQGKSGYAPWTMPGGTWRDSVPFDKGAAAVSQAGLGDMGGIGDYGNYPTPASQIHPQINFHNTFAISGGGGAGGGIDLRRTVTTIADHLENEMKNRLLRTS